MNILITGGAGYIGSHTVLECLNAGHEVIVIDNLINASVESLKRVEQLTGKSVYFYEGGIEDRALLDKIFSDHQIDAVIHFAALKAVGESCEQPLEYYANNLSGTIVLLQAMRKAGVENIIFSSSATVYGNRGNLLLAEDFPTVAASPYAATKIMIERILTDMTVAYAPFKAVLLRYFNPVGAHPSGVIGEDPRGIPNNLTPYLTQVAIGKRPELAIFGADYDTPDGTCVRDYIHVVDLAKGHLAAVMHLSQLPFLSIFNLGTGKGSSVLALVETFEKVTGVKIPRVIVGRRAGDVPYLCAAVDKAKQQLGWVAQYDLADMLRDSWNWQQKNPCGFVGNS